MSERLYSVELRGREHRWSINVMSTPERVEEWRADGIDVGEVMNTFPVWVAELGYWPTRAWCFVQDVFNFRNPFV